ncbi:hypothetical protein [Halolamina salifodinae]|uniref:Uncharacterized protein n=1 Tax=Halolamina salifodinae TaxID=1202767 RepID=A0A8T4GTI3_9EURY|nr:hypothetical protein [Halolamina salifodinae]MBP1985710.1 hypothetical protein [Halolamina salifodinae]
MKRRRFLPLAAVALSGCLGARDESGPRTPPLTPKGGPTPEGGRNLRIVDAVPREGEDGSLVFAVTVENTAASSQRDTLVGIATVQGESGSTEYEARRQVSLDGNTEAEFDLVFDVAYEQWAGNGGISYGWQGQL